MIIVDAHLDLSYNALKGRDVLRPAVQQPADGDDIPTVGLPDLRAGGVGLICATVFCAPAEEGRAGYSTADEARGAGLRHLEWYRRQIDAGTIRFVTSRRQLSDLPGSAQAAILLLEGADPVTSGEDVAQWFAAGLRIVGLAWKRTRHAGGTGAPGPLTAEGVELVKTLDRFGIIHDTSHLAEESFWQLLDQSNGPIIASHSNCRSIVPTDRQLSDEMIRAIIARRGVVGINFFDKFLLPPSQYGRRRATLADVIAHIRHICDLAGDTAHVGLGTDMDGGLGRNEIPIEIRTSADLPRLADALFGPRFFGPGRAGHHGAELAELFLHRTAVRFRIKSIAMEIRPATASDVPAVLSMVAAIAALHESWDPAKFGYRAHPEEMYRRWLGARAIDPRSVFLVAVRENRPVAFLIATAEEEIPIYRLREFGFIHDIWVEPEYRHEGLGRQLVMSAIARFGEMGMKQVRCDTAAANEPARALMRSCGMRPSTTEMLIELPG